MIENAFRGSARYYAWLIFLLMLIGAAGGMFLLQYRDGLGVTAMSRDVSWGLYIAQLNFLVGVAASAVMVVLPYYLHDFKAFGRITILGEFLAIPAVLIAPLFVVVDLGQPFRVMNLFLYPTPNSMMFWDTISIFGYLILNIVIGWQSLAAEKKGFAPAKWVRGLAFLSIPWAVSIHTVTAFLYAGLPSRPFWFTAVLAPRFLASAFAAGPALLIILCFIVRRVSKYDPGEVAIAKLAHIVTYGMIINVFLFGMELFTALYSGMHHHIVHVEYLFFGHDGQLSSVAPFMWLSAATALISLFLLIYRKTRTNHYTLVIACVMVFVSIWIDKGAGMMTGGMIPTPLGSFVSYFPSWVEITMTIGLYALGAFVLTVLYKVAISVKEAGITE